MPGREPISAIGTQAVILAGIETIGTGVILFPLGLQDAVGGKALRPTADPVELALVAALGVGQVHQ